MQGCKEPPAQLTAQFPSLQKWRLAFPFLSVSHLPSGCLQPASRSPKTHGKPEAVSCPSSWKKNSTLGAVR